MLNIRRIIKREIIRELKKQVFDVEKEKQLARDMAQQLFKSTEEHTTDNDDLYEYWLSNAGEPDDLDSDEDIDRWERISFGEFKKEYKRLTSKSPKKEKTQSTFRVGTFGA